jgi:hypothetical protein
VVATTMDVAAWAGGGAARGARGDDELAEDEGDCQLWADMVSVATESRYVPFLLQLCSSFLCCGCCRDDSTLAIGVEEEVGATAPAAKRGGPFLPRV